MIGQQSADIFEGDVTSGFCVTFQLYSLAFPGTDDRTNMGVIMEVDYVFGSSSLQRNKMFSHFPLPQV